jgi:hypothetical protein
MLSFFASQNAHLGQKPFPSPFSFFQDYGSGMPAATARELRMMYLSQSIREKPAWREKMQDPDIVAKWTQEAIAQVVG